MARKKLLSLWPKSLRNSTVLKTPIFSTTIGWRRSMKTNWGVFPTFAQLPSLQRACKWEYWNEVQNGRSGAHSVIMVFWKELLEGVETRMLFPWWYDSGDAAVNPLCRLMYGLLMSCTSCLTSKGIEDTTSNGQLGIGLCVAYMGLCTSVHYCHKSLAIGFPLPMAAEWWSHQAVCCQLSYRIRFAGFLTAGTQARLTALWTMPFHAIQRQWRWCLKC